MHIEVPAVPFKELRGKTDGVTSAQIRERVEATREIQSRRGFYNAQIPAAQLQELCALDEQGERTLEMAVRRMNPSARSHDRILRVANLDRTGRVSAKHLAEAVQFRNLDRNYWS
jgi:magnesium chelatase family protein